MSANDAPITLTHPMSGAIESAADSLPATRQAMLLVLASERRGRMIDHDHGSAALMGKKQQEGCF